jgi:hypothetical protein
MAKKRKQISSLEKIEAYFSTENEHYNSYSFEVYNEAKRKNLFSDFEIPLWIFDYATNEFYTNRTKPLHALEELKKTFEKEKLTTEQKQFILSHLIKYFKETVYLNEAVGSEVTLSKAQKLLETELACTSPKEETKNPNGFAWSNTLKHVATIKDLNEKIKYLVEQGTRYKQQSHYDWQHPNYGEKCDLEINKLRALAEIESTSTQIKATSRFKLSKALSKIDYIRIINALYELRCFQNNDETYPNKIDVMIVFGNLVNIDLSNYTNDLNKAFNSNVSVEQNIEIFDKLKRKTQDLYLNRQNKPKK